MRRERIDNCTQNGSRPLSPARPPRPSPLAPQLYLTGSAWIRSARQTAQFSPLSRGQIPAKRTLRELALRLGQPRVVRLEERVDLVEHEERRRLIAIDATYRREHTTANKLTEGTTDLWIAKSNARAAIVFSPPDNCSMSRKRFMGGIAWYLIPAVYGSYEFTSVCHTVSSKNYVSRTSLSSNVR